MMSKKNVLIWAFAAFAGMLFSVTPNVQGGDNGRVRYDGAWLVTGPPGIRFLETITSLDPSGRRVAVQLVPLSVDATGIICCPGAEYLSLAIGEGVMTGPRTLEASLMAYSMRSPTQEEWDEGERRDQVVCIWEISASSTFTEDTQDGLGILKIIPSTDADGDMLPDEGDEPCLIGCLPLALTAKRVPVVTCE
jgi:hypothetical protein